MPPPLPPRVRRLTAEERATEAEPAFSSVFASKDPFGTPFQPDVERKALLYPVSDKLERGQFDALSGAAAAVGEDAAYHLITELEDEDMAAALELPLDDYAVYAAAMQASHPLLERALFSRQGTWGLLFSRENHLLAGGPARFIDLLLDRFPAAESPPVMIDVSPEDMQRLPEGLSDIDDVAAYFGEHGTRAEPLSGLGTRDQVGAFAVEVRRWQDDYGTNPAWFERLLEHLYGPSEAARILAPAGLEDRR
jgi:hypothetical protein